MREVNRRRFLHAIAAGGGAAAGLFNAPAAGSERRPSYDGPNVIVIRFGGGVRRRETIDPAHTHSPFLAQVLAERGVLYPNMEIASLDGVATSHGQGTLYILTGKYDKYKDVGDKFLGSRFEAKVPTLFEYLRAAYDVPAHQTLIINGEDRTDEEFYSFSNHHAFGVDYRSNVLSLYRFKTYLLREQVNGGGLDEKQLAEKKKELEKLEAIDYRTAGEDRQGVEIERFWERWRSYYGDSGLVNPRGDRLLTELTLRALKQLRPRLAMINFNDPDYVHWGNPSHYTRGISIIDRGLERIVGFVESDEFYRGNTVFAIVPDCGRDDNPFGAVPFQHHFNTRSSHQIWALFFGDGVARGARVEKTVDQVSIAATVGALMGSPTRFTEGPALEQVFV